MKILVVDDNPILREGLRSLLIRRGHEVHDADNGTDAVAQVATTSPAIDIVVMDIRMPPTHTDEGVQAAIRIKRNQPHIGVLLFSQYAEVQWARTLLDVATSGVGYLLKDRVADIGPFIDSLHQVAAGNVVLDPEVAAALVKTPTHIRPELALLRPREIDVLRLMAEGRSNSAIAAELFLSTGTVEKHVTAIFTKLNLETSPSNHRRVLAVVQYLAA